MVFQPNDKTNLTHGMSYTRLYRIYRNIRSRCENPNTEYYERYGGRGIRVCPEWKYFDAFMTWALSNGYEDSLTIDRIDNSGGYYPENCRWVTQRQNNRNQRSNVLLTIDDETKTVADWAEDPRCKVSVKALRRRLKLGWLPEKAVMEPSQYA